MESSSAWIIVMVVSILLSAFFSGMEIAFVSANKVRVEIDVKKSGLINRIIHVFYNHSDMFISTLLIGNNVVNVVYSIAMSALLTEPLKHTAVGGNEVLMLLLPNYSLRMFSLPLFMCYLVLYPISKFTEWISQGVMRLLGIKADKSEIGSLSLEELDAYLQENIDKKEDENVEVDREMKIFENALDFSDTHLRDCMVPRNEIVGVDIADTTRDDLVQLFGKTGLSKLVVYHDDIDNVLGFISVSELFVTDVNWKDQVKPVLFAPETMLAKVMMQNLLHEKRSMAIVVDEFGGTAGMVTLEDLVEEIFGDIEDEHDRNRNKLVARQIGDNTYEFSGRKEIEEINEEFHLDLPESDEYQTIAGLILHELEAMPNEGDHIEVEGGYTLTVLRKSAARIELVRVVASGNNDKEAHDE